MLERHKLDFLGPVDRDRSIREQDLTRRVVSVQFHVGPVHAVPLVSHGQQFAVVHEATLDASAQDFQARVSAHVTQDSGLCRYG